MKYLLDTNICIYIIKRKPPEVLDRFRAEGCFIVMRGNPEGIVFVGAHGRAPLAETVQFRSRIFFRKHESALGLRRVVRSRGPDD